MKHVIFLTNIYIKTEKLSNVFEGNTCNWVTYSYNGKIFKTWIAYVTLYGPADRLCRTHHHATQKWSRARTWPQWIFDIGPVSFYQDVFILLCNALLTDISIFYNRIIFFSIFAKIWKISGSRRSKSFMQKN